jgi:hypothetical protein
MAVVGSRSCRYIGDLSTGCALGHRLADAANTDAPDRCQPPPVVRDSYRRSGRLTTDRLAGR